MELAVPIPSVAVQLWLVTKKGPRDSKRKSTRALLLKWATLRAPRKTPSLWEAKKRSPFLELLAYLTWLGSGRSAREKRGKRGRMLLKQRYKFTQPLLPPRWLPFGFDSVKRPNCEESDFNVALFFHSFFINTFNVNNLIQPFLKFQFKCFMAKFPIYHLPLKKFCF